jgi:hypothetical protein
MEFKNKCHSDGQNIYWQDSNTQTAARTANEETNGPDTQLLLPMFKLLYKGLSKDFLRVRGKCACS